MDMYNTNEDKEHFKKSITTNGITKTICIDAVENGYVVRISTYGKIGDDYLDESKTFISSKDPREMMGNKEKDTIDDKGILNSLSSFINM